MKRIYQIAAVVVLIILILIFKDWLRSKIIVSLGGYTKQTTTITVDSTYVKGDVDTLAVFNHYVKTNGIILNPDPKIVYKYEYLDPVSKKVVAVDSVKQFQVQLKDSLVDGTINVTNKFNGDLLNANFDYKPLFPKYIKRVDTIRTTKTITKFLSKERSKFGFGAGYDWQQSSVQFLGSYTTKKDWQFIYEYETSLNQSLINGLPRQVNHSIKIIKSF